MAELQDLVTEDIRGGLEKVGYVVADVEIRTIVEGGSIGLLDGEDPGDEHRAETHHWTATAEHARATSGLPPTDREVEIEGMTIVLLPDEGDPQFLRVIDWASVHARLGFVLESRSLAPLGP